MRTDVASMLARACAGAMLFALATGEGLAAAPRTSRVSPSCASWVTHLE